MLPLGSCFPSECRGPWSRTNSSLGFHRLERKKLGVNAGRTSSTCVYSKSMPNASCWKLTCSSELPPPATAPILRKPRAKPPCAPQSLEVADDRDLVWSSFSVSLDQLLL